MMIERIARALHARSFHSQIAEGAVGGEQLPSAPWEDLTADARRRRLADATAALDAMREPDEAMKAAGAEFFEEGDPKQNAFAAEIVYSAMVEAGLQAAANA